MNAVQVIESVKENGGGTIHAITGQTPTKGFMVAVGKDYAEIAPASVLDSVNDAQKTLGKFTKDHADLLNLPDYFIGLWLNAGKLYLDVAQNIWDPTIAILAGINRNQIAIWDVVNGCEIPTGGTGEI